MDARTLNLYIIAVYKLLIFLLGIVGNLLFIHLIIKKKQLQSRTSILQCFQCFFHLFCQLGTIMTGVTDIGLMYNRRDCYNQIGFYVFFQAAQGLIMLIIVADILVFVKFPTYYRGISNSKYIFITAFPILTFSIFTTVYGYTTTNEELIYSCSPPFAFSAEASVLYKYLFILLAVIIMIFYLVLIKTFYQRSQSNHQSSLKTVKRLQLTVFIFIFTWFISQILGLIIVETPVFSKWGGMILAHNVIFVCLSYSNTFYVTMWRSKEYRDQFYNVWWPKTMQITSVTAFHTSSTSQKSNHSDLMCHRRI